ncbi:MAG: hypothetical protein LJE62_13575 [Silicimonas sp.]|jgi:hypothetical protein|nr:hypothetical protein [Silicimonas sp.]
MRTRITKLALSGLTAFSLAFAPMPASAADGEDIAKAIAGLAILGIIAKAASDRDDRQTSRSADTRYWPYGRIERDENRRVIEGEIRRPGHGSSKFDDRYKRAKLPDACRLIVDTRHGDRNVYGKYCLARQFKYANRLPSRCEILVRDGGRPRLVYGSHCLAREGWRVARR